MHFSLLQTEFVNQFSERGIFRRAGGPVYTVVAAAPTNTPDLSFLTGCCWQSHCCSTECSAGHCMNIYAAVGEQDLQFAEFHATTATDMQMFNQMWMHKPCPTQLFLVCFGDCGEAETVH